MSTRLYQHMSIFLFLWVIISGCSLPPEEKMAVHLARGVEYFERELYQEAVIEFKNMIQIEPTSPEGHYRLGLTYMKRGKEHDLLAAFHEFAKTVSLDSKNLNAQLDLAELYLHSDQPSKAIEHVRIVLTSTPENQDGLIILGKSLLREKNFQEGLNTLKKVVDLYPRNIRGQLALSKGYYEANNLTKAEAMLKKAVMVDPHSIEARVAQGDFYLLSHGNSKAEEAYKVGLELSPGEEVFYLRLGRLYQITNKPEMVVEIYHRLAMQNPQSERPQILLGNFYALTGQHEKALLRYRYAVQLNPQSIIARNKLIQHYLNIGKLDTVKENIDFIAKQNKKDIFIPFFSAQLHLIDGKSDRAIDLLQKVLEDNPRFAEAYHYLGLALLARNEQGQAQRAFKQSVKLAPELIKARTALARLYLTEGLYDQAIEQAGVAIRLNGRDVQAASILGEAYFQKGDLTKAKRLFTTIVKNSPNEWHIHYQLGRMALAQQNPNLAISHFEKTLSLNPNFFEPLTEIASIYLTQGDPPEAQKRVIQQLRVSPGNPLLYNLLGKLWSITNDWDQAEASYKVAIESDDTFPISYMNLSELYLRRGQIGQAIQEYHAVLTKDPHLLPAHMMLGILYELQEQYDRAKQEYQEVLKLDPNYAPAANNLAWMLIERGGDRDRPVALTYASQAYEQHSDDPFIADTLGWIYYEMNRVYSATPLLRQAAEKLPNNSTVLYHYGMALQKKGDTDGAIKSFRRSLRVNESFPEVEKARDMLARLLSTRSTSTT